MSFDELLLNRCSTYEVATACALAIGAEKLICIIDGQILDENGRPIRFLTLDEADMLIRKRAKQSETAANYVEAVSQGDAFGTCLGSNNRNGAAPPYNGSRTLSHNGKGFLEKGNATFQNGVGFDNGNGLWESEQGFAIGGLERQSRLDYLAELAVAALVCRVTSYFFYLVIILLTVVTRKSCLDTVRYIFVAQFYHFGANCTILPCLGYVPPQLLLAGVDHFWCQLS